MLPGTLYYSTWNNNGTCRFVIYVLVLVSQSLRSPRKMAGLSKIHRTHLMVNPDGGAWWAAIYGVAQGRTRLKQLSSSSNSNLHRRGSLKLCTSRVLRAKRKATLRYTAPILLVITTLPKGMGTWLAL